MAGASAAATRTKTSNLSKHRGRQLFFTKEPQISQLPFHTTGKIKPLTFGTGSINIRKYISWTHALPSIIVKLHTIRTQANMTTMRFP
jgi:hypothetical protein